MTFARISIQSLFTAMVLLALAASLSACAVGLAATGEETPDVTQCHVGAERHEIEAQVGPPRTSDTDASGNTTCTYEYKVGDDPSAGRAVYHAGMDVLTLGLWELVGTPYEALQGETYEMTVVYGPDGTAKEITSRPVERTSKKKQE